jgi:(E)-4-hydroxy-3-methylbut-2-enyl-diphosphate synthase
MTNTDTADFDATLRQVGALFDAGCDLVRLAVRDTADIAVCKKLVKASRGPLSADIQFDYRLAVAAADAGFSKVRFNPGNVGGEAGVREIAAACKANGTAVRVGVNSGSIERDMLDKYGYSDRALAESALKGARLLEKAGFTDTVLSAKASSVKLTVDTYRYLRGVCDYPLHLGVTESGAYASGLLKSAVGLGALLLDGIGDTLRVSLSGDPVREIGAGRAILRAAGVDTAYCEVISCPTCARCRFDLNALAEEIERRTAHIKRPLKVAVMGCAVNGPGEAKHADLGVCGGGEGQAVLFVRGEVVKRIDPKDAARELMALIETYDERM